MMATSTSFTLLTTLLTLTSCCFISDCPGRGNKRMLYSFRAGIPGQASPESPNVGPLLLDVPGKKDLRFMYDMPYRNLKPRAVKDQFFLNVPGKRDFYDMLHNYNRPRITPRQSKYLKTSCWTQGGKSIVSLYAACSKLFG
jgi:hypothetical protein